MENPVGEVFGKISGRWALNHEFRFPRIELDEKNCLIRLHLAVLISSGVIATLRLIPNSTGCNWGDDCGSINRSNCLPSVSRSPMVIICRSAVTVSLGVISVIVASAVISMILGITYI